MSGREEVATEAVGGQQSEGPRREVGGGRGVQVRRGEHSIRRRGRKGSFPAVALWRQGVSGPLGP